MEQRLLSVLTGDLTGLKDKPLLSSPLRFEVLPLQQLAIIILTNATEYQVVSTYLQISLGH